MGLDLPLDDMTYAFVDNDSDSSSGFEIGITEAKNQKKDESMDKQQQIIDTP